MPEFDVRSWYGLLAPAGTPKAIIQKISTDVQEILAQTEMKDKFAALELDPMPSSSEQFQLYLRTETEKFSLVVKAANIKAAD
jgi:tripartite-type tricarboxylate transporter receptor subunit TctC